jgi:hypothetical protein
MVSQKGSAPILLLLAAIGLLAFLAISSTAPFQDGLFAMLYPKKASFASGPIVTSPSPSPFSTPIASASGSVIKIYAAGTPANGIYPTMQLILAGRPTKNFTNVKADPAIRPFTEYSYTIPVPVRVTPDLVRVAYVNDLRVGPGNDRNLFVDKINIDGVDYESERPTTHSTGSWNFSQRACIPGSYQTEALVCNGYFEYR